MDQIPKCKMEIMVLLEENLGRKNFTSSLQCLSKDISRRNPSSFVRNIKTRKIYCPPKKTKKKIHANILYENTWKKPYQNINRLNSRNYKKQLYSTPSGTNPSCANSPHENYSKHQKRCRKRHELKR